MSVPLPENVTAISPHSRELLLVATSQESADDAVEALHELGKHIMVSSRFEYRSTKSDNARKKG